MSLRARAFPYALVLLAGCGLSGCGKSAHKPTDADVAAYLGQSEPAYTKVGDVSASFEAVADSGSARMPAGSWRVHVTFSLKAAEDLYAPETGYAARRTAFDAAVRGAEAYRVARIAAVEQLAQRAGLIRPGDPGPALPLPAMVVTHAGQVLPDQVTLLAQPDGGGWKFFQLNAQALSDDAIGEPLADLRRAHTHTAVVMAGSEADRASRARAAQFLAILQRNPALQAP